MKPIRQAIFNVQKEMRVNGDSKELQHVLDLLCKIDKGKNFAIPVVNNCFKEVIVEEDKDKNRDWLGESF